MLEDWIFDENLKPFVETLARSIGYGFDDWDWDAIRYGVQETDYEIDRWYGYEFAGRRLVRFSLAQSSYSSRIFVRVDAEGRQRSVEVAEENLRPFVETLAGSAGYSFDDWDWDAIKYGVEETNYEADRWYGYEFAGKKLVKFCTAKDPGSSVVFVRINADEDLEGRAEVAIQIMKIYRLSTEP